MPRIAWFSPITADATSPALKAAQYTRVVVPLLPADWDVTLFVDDEDWGLMRSARKVPELGGCKLASFHSAAREHARQPFDFPVYQLADAGKCAFVQRQLRLWPGLVVFHDIWLNSLYRSYFAHSTGGTDLDSLMQAEFGAQAPHAGQWQVRNWQPEILDHWYRLGEREWKAATVALVGSEAEQRWLEQRVQQKVMLSGALSQMGEPQASKQAADELVYLCTRYSGPLRGAFRQSEDELRAYTHSRVQELMQALQENPTWLSPSGEDVPFPPETLAVAARHFGWSRV